MLATRASAKPVDFGQRSKAHAIVDKKKDKTLDGLVKGLYSYKKERIIGALNQIKIGGAAYVDGFNSLALQVSRLMSNQDREVACLAIHCFSLLGDKAEAHLQQLEGCLASPAVSVRVAALEAFGCLAPFVTNEQVIAGAASDSEAAVRAKFCQAVMMMEATSFHQKVSNLLEDPVPEVQGAAIEALGALMIFSDEIQSIYGDKVGDVLSNKLEDPRTRIAALNTIVTMGEQAPSTCTSAVVSTLGDSDIFTRHSAVAAFEAVADSAVASNDGIARVKDLLASSDAGIRASAACALGAMGEKASSSAEAVAKLLDDQAEDTSGAAYVMGNGASRPPAQMRRPKCAAVTALASIAGEEYIGKISEALNDASWEVRMCAAEALATLGGKAKSEVSALIGSMEDDVFSVRAMCCYALGQIADTEAVPRLVEALEDKAYSVRLHALVAIAEMGEAAEEHSHEVFLLTDDTSNTVRAAALKTLAKLGSTGQNYAGLVASMLSDQDPEVRIAACEALAGMGDAGAACVEDIEELMSDTPPVRAAAMTALESMGVYIAPFRKDFGKGLGIANGKPAILMPGQVSVEGMGLYFNELMQKKEELTTSGKWIEGVI